MMATKTIPTKYQMLCFKTRFPIVLEIYVDALLIVTKLIPAKIMIVIIILKSNLSFLFNIIFSLSLLLYQIFAIFIY